MEVTPNLPHYRSNRNETKPKKQVFKYLNGIAFPLQEGDPETTPKVSVLKQKGEATSLIVGRRPENRQKPVSGQTVKFVSNCNDVLCFYGYFKESVTESRLENHRVRKCEIYYYLEDDSIQIVENKQENSGIPQGTFVKRHQVPKDDDSFFTLDDFVIGQTLNIYGRVFHLISCNSATKRFLEEKLGRAPIQSLPYPVDRFEMDRREFMARETGCEVDARHNVRKNPMKQFAEAKLGNTVDNSRREGFLKFDRKVLRFNCIWDDRSSLYGDLQEFKLHYFLTDNTIEVLTVHAANNGRDPYPLLLKRARLPKEGATSEAEKFYHWRDLVVGAEVSVYARQLLLVDADAQTRAFYESQGQPLAEPLEVRREEKQTVERQLPPYTGFGSEEDSLASCVGSLVLKPPRKQFKDNKTLRYMAHLITTVPEDMDRSFIIQYFITDDTIMVTEPPKRNSGIIGGKFLARMKFKHPDQTPILQGDLFIGQEIVLLSHRFKITDCDDAALNYMELNPEIYPESDIIRVGRLVQSALRGVTANGSLYKAFAEYDTANNGTVSKESLQEILSSYGLNTQVTDQGLLTLCRAFGGLNTSMMYEDFLNALKTNFSRYSRINDCEF